MHPVLDGYAPCPETLALDRFNSYDDTDVLAAAVPKPLLLMAGAADEVFTADMSRSIADDVTDSFNAADLPERFSFFLDPGGHAYTVAMAEHFADWMDQWVRGSKSRPTAPFTEADLEVLPADTLACHPRQDVNMFVANRLEAEKLRESRDGDPVAVARTLAGLDGEIRFPMRKQTSLRWCGFTTCRNYCSNPTRNRTALHISVSIG